MWPACLQAYDARALSLTTEFVSESNDLAGHDVTNLWVPPNCDALFAATADNGIIQYRCAHACMPHLPLCIFHPERACA